MSNRRRAKDSGLLFVYDRVCTQDEKEREMSREYGVGVSADNPSREQPYRGTFADEGHRRAVEAARDPASSPSRPLVTEEKNRAQAIPRRKKRPTAPEREQEPEPRRSPGRTEASIPTVPARPREERQ